jgi:hypothetical protein
MAPWKLSVIGFAAASLSLDLHRRGISAELHAPRYFFASPKLVMRFRIKRAKSNLRMD